MAHRTAEFTNRDGTRLKARIEMPEGKLRAVALFAHCFTCTMQSHAATRLTMALAAHGIATMRFDFTGLGGSEGDFANAGFAADIADIVAAADHLRGSIGAPALLIGHSLGGAAVLAAAAAVPEARAVVTIGAPFDPAHVLERLDGDLAAIERDGSGDVRIGGRAFRISAAFLNCTKDSMPAAQIAGLKRALLVLHAPHDSVVGIDNARRIFEAARHPKSFVALDGADHLLTRLADATYAAALIATWAERYIDAPAASDQSAAVSHRPAAADPPAAARPPAGTVGAATTASKFGILIRTDSHDFVVDEPVAAGGDDAGPGPYDLLLGALGSCTAITLKVVAARENIPLDGVTVSLNHDRNHARDCDHCLDAHAKVEAVHRTLTLAGNLDDTQRARLLVIADKCPVHRTLTGHLHIHTTLVPAA